MIKDKPHIRVSRVQTRLIGLVLCCILVVTGCRTTAPQTTVQTKEDLRIASEKTFYVSRGPWDSPLSHSLAEKTTSSAMTKAFEEQLKSQGLRLANKADEADFMIIPAFRLEDVSPLSLFEPKVESFNMIVYDKATSTVMVGVTKECCPTISEVASQAASVLHSIVKQKIAYPPVLAQSPVTDDPCADAKSQFELDLDQRSWGPIYPEQVLFPKMEDPSASVLVGKKLSYLTSYLECYHSEVKSMKVRRALLGCVGGFAVSALTLTWIFMPR